jgi:RNA-directed DNA polymerase
LDVLQGEPAIEKFFQVETSFGGIKDRSVRKAIEAACTAISNGAKFFIRSDIKKFFPNIPRHYVKKQISELIPDTEFNKLFSEATDTELKNLDYLKKQSELFPLYEVGVAQGCCLSPLIGNILLYDFDVKMNGRGITCLRYIDDFIILGPNFSKTISAFKSAKQYLNKFKLDTYDPQTEKEKAEIGEVRHGFKYLGCEIVPGLISPNKKSRKRLLSSIDQIFQRSIKLMSDPNKMCLEMATVSETLLNVSNVLRGWGNQYSFCNNRQIIQNLDLQIDRRLEKYLSIYKKKKKELEDRDFPKNRRRLIGVHLLEDSKYDPILK